MAEQPGIFPDSVPPRDRRIVRENPIPFSCIPLSPDTVEATARLYTEVFVLDEPMTRWHREKEEDFLSFARKYVHFCETEGLSCIAREEITGKVIGFIFCSDLTMDLDALGPDMREYLTRFDAIIQLIEALEEKYLTCHNVKPGIGLHINQLGICREGRNRSVSTALIRHIVASARERGFQKIVADCTGPLSCRSFENAGFVRAGSIRYSSFILGGCAFFNGLEGEITLMVKDL